MCRVGLQSVHADTIGCCVNVWNSYNLLHVQMVQQVGNRQARCIYEAGLPENFRRPQTDSYPLLVPAN